jgi:hypothetical protein
VGESVGVLWNACRVGRCLYHVPNDYTRGAGLHVVWTLTKAYLVRMIQETCHKERIQQNSIAEVLYVWNTPHADHLGREWKRHQCENLYWEDSPPRAAHNKQHGM